MFDFFVIPQYASLRGKLVLKTVIYNSKLLGFQYFVCLPYRICECKYSIGPQTRTL